MSANPLPIIKRRDVIVTKSRLKDVNDLADYLVEDELGLADVSYFEPHARAGMTNTGHIIIGDTTEIPHALSRTPSFMEYRLSLLAAENDLVIIGRGRNADFESYLKGILESSSITFAAVKNNTLPVEWSSPISCLKDDTSYQILLKYSTEQDEISIIPHITTGAIWALARRLGIDTGATILVAGSPPKLSSRVNDKIWFAEVTKKLLGAPSTPLERTAFSLVGLVSQLRALSRYSEQLVIKVPNSAGSQGNFAIQSSRITEMRPKALCRYLTSLIADAGWEMRFPLMVQIWEHNVLTSPSVQIWIPHLSEGAPIIEGLFDQYITNAAGQFSGAVAADLPEYLDRKISDDAFLIASLFQKIGYFGRCSLDTVVTGADLDTARVHWIECNGRWGGVSVPMTFVNKINGVNSAFAVVQLSGLNLPKRSFLSVLEVCKEYLWQPGSRRGIVIMSPQRISAGVGADFIAIGDTTAEATSLAQDCLHALSNSS